MICYKYHIYALIQDRALKNASSNNLGRQISFGKLNIDKKVPFLQVFSHTFFRVTSLEQLSVAEFSGE